MRMRIPIAALFSLALVGLGGCGDDTSNDSTADVGITDTGATGDGWTGLDTSDALADTADVESATLEGRVDGARAKTIEGAVMTAAIVEADGSLTQLTTTGEVMTDAMGRYELEILLVDRIDQPIVVTATSGNDIGAALHLRGVDGDSDVTIAPIDVETTMEAEVVIEARSSGMWCASCDANDVRARLNAETAAALAATTDVEGQTRIAADAMVRATAATWAAFASDATDATVETWGEFERERAEAHAELVAALDASADADARAEAEAEYMASVNAALDQVGVSMNDAAIASHTEAVATADSLAMLEADAQAAARAAVESNRAERVSVAMEALAESSTTADAEAVMMANTTLMGRIGAAASMGASADAEIRDAWDTWSNEIRTAFTADFGAELVAVVTTFESTLDTATDAWLSAVLSAQADMDAEASATAIADAMALLRTSIESEATVDALVAAGLTDADATAWVTAMTHVAATGTTTR